MTRVEKAEHFLSMQCRLGEGSRWNVGEQRLYWVDIENGLFYRYDLGRTKGGAQPERFEVGLPVGVLAFREKGGLVMATRDGFATWDFASQAPTFIADPEAGKMDARFNDGAVDPAGRFWAGTMTTTGATSSLYRLDPDGSVHTMESGLAISNGIGWSPDRRTMYLTDSPRFVIYAYDFDVQSGSISNKRVFMQGSEAEGQPDGLAMDSKGYVWSAHWGGYCVKRYDPSGKIERIVELPVSQVTCCAFGGPDLTDLYITSAWSGLSAQQRAKEPLAGDIFLIRTDIRGQEDTKFSG
jgi:sugar lactone lactonase YvrE